MYLVNADFSCLGWPVGIRRDINKDDDSIQGPNACDREDNVHLGHMIASDDFDQPRYLENIPSREVVESLEFYWGRDTSSGSLRLMEGSN